MSYENAFSLEHVSISFNGIQVLKDVNFALRRNEIHAIAGKNGAGKSTLMKILTGVYKASSGKITIFDKEVPLNPLKSGIAMVYQDLSLVPSMSVTQNIFLSHHPFRRYGLLQDNKAKNLVLELFELMGGIDFISPDALISELSVGEAQLVEIAKALAGEPKIIVFDEPTAALSNVETAQLFQTIQTLKERGISIIYITHYLEDILDLCHQVTVLRDGEVAFSEKTSQTSIDEIVQHMLGPEANKQLFRRNNKCPQAENKKPLLLVRDAVTEKVGPLSMCAYPGEIIGLAGLLGSGRTEILRLLYGLDPLHSGTIHIHGTQVKFSSPAKAVEHGISLVPEERRSQGLVLDFSIAHNLSLCILQQLRKFHLLSDKSERAVARHSVANLQVKLRDIYQAVRFLSGGNQQKVVFGKCLLAKPQILLLDDPTFGVDVHAKSEIMKIIEEYAAEGNIVIFVSSELAEIANFCDRIYIVKKKGITEEVPSLSEEELLKKVQ